jgi:hypothetical protein
MHAELIYKIENASITYIQAPHSCTVSARTKFPTLGVEKEVAQAID